MMGLNRMCYLFSLLIVNCFFFVQVSAVIIYRRQNGLQLSASQNTGTNLKTGSSFLTPTPISKFMTSPSPKLASSIGNSNAVLGKYQTNIQTQSLSSLQSNTQINSTNQSINNSASISSASLPSIVSSSILSLPLNKFSTLLSSAPISVTNIPPLLLSKTQPANSTSTTTTTTTQPPAPPLVTMLTPPLLPTYCGSQQGCCYKALEQLPGGIQFSESLPKGSVLTDIKGVWNVTFDVKVSSPAYVSNVIKDYFVIIQTSADEYALTLTKEIDLEDVFLKTGQKGDVHEFQVQVNCVGPSSKRIVSPPRLINVTVNDVDDAMPVFLHNDATADCAVPIYRADTTEDYMGIMSITPVQIQAVDGDVNIHNNITYRVMHAEPDDYHVYFSLNSSDGTVNKTKVMNVNVRNKYVLFVQAVEDSAQQRSRVAVLAIVVYPAPVRHIEPTEFDPRVRTTLAIISVLLFIFFLSGLAVIIHHRYRLKTARVAAEMASVDVIRDVIYPRRTINTSVSSLDYKPIEETSTVASPTQVVVRPSRSSLFAEKPAKPVARRPLDPTSRPQWNAPSQKQKRVMYNPYIRQTTC